MSNEVDDLMNRLAEDTDVEGLIAHYRKLRANYDSGGKPTKKSENKPRAELVELGLIKPKPGIRKI